MNASGERPRIFFSGPSLQRALIAAARHFKLEPEEIAYRLRERRSGFVEGSPKVVIEVDAAAPRRAALAAPAPTHAAAVPPRREPGPPPSTPRPERPRAGSEESGQRAQPSVAVAMPQRAPSRALTSARGPAAEAVLEAWARACRLAGLAWEAEVLEGEGRFVVRPAAREDVSREVLSALGDLVPRLVRALAGEPVRCEVEQSDSSEREERLRSQAREVALLVLRDQRAQTLPAMNPADRRIVHMEIADMAGLATASEGEGTFKRVKISPK